MKAPSKTVPHVPPLIRPPSWASVEQLRGVELGNLYQTAQEMSVQIAELIDKLSTVPAPKPVALSEVSIVELLRSARALASSLRVLEYPAELTEWVSSSRSLAAQLVARLSDALAQLQTVATAKDTTPAYCRDLATVRLIFADAQDVLTMLQQKTAERLEQQASFPDIVGADDEDSRNIWSEGWRSGLWEAMALIRQAFLVDHDGTPHLSPYLMLSAVDWLLFELAARVNRAETSHGTLNMRSAS